MERVRLFNRWKVVPTGVEGAATSSLVHHVIMAGALLERSNNEKGEVTANKGSRVESATNLRPGTVVIIATLTSIEDSNLAML